jgi:thiosulfate/3-mercaptopyruvate sulfurtransferase
MAARARAYVRSLAACLTLLGVAGSAVAQSPDSLLVSTTWLAGHLSDARLVVIQVAGDRREYGNVHIPGARFLAYDDFVSEPSEHGKGLNTELPPVDKIKAALEAIGVSNDSRIVLYGTGPTIVARLFMTLDWLGLGARTSILDGGLPRWREERRAVAHDEPAVTRGILTVAQRKVVVDAAWVNANRARSDVAIVDARDRRFYLGDHEPQMHAERPGRIPGAHSVPFSSLMTEPGVFKDRTALAAAFREAGVEPGRTVVTYCHLGQQGSLVYFVARYLGFDARLYDGSYEDWSARSELPIVRGPSPSGR